MRIYAPALDRDSGAPLPACSGDAWPACHRSAVAPSHASNDRARRSGARRSLTRYLDVHLGSLAPRQHHHVTTASLVPKARLPLAHLLGYGWMPSVLKRWAYRVFRGYRIGKGVRFGFGSAVIGDDVVLGDYVEIGLLAVVQGREIRIGRHSSVGTLSYLSCHVIHIGEDARIREQVYVGGPLLPESRFELGSRTIVLQMTSINPTKPVVIGDDTGIGGHCLIFTHGAWLNVLDGYPATYEPVTIGRSVWLPWRVFVMPGSTIGDGTVIGANSLVAGAIPARSLAVGTPAKVIRAEPAFPPPVSTERKHALVEEMLREFDRYVSDAAVHITREGELTVYTRDEVIARLWRTAGQATRAGDTVLSETALPAATLATFRARRVHWLDLAGRSRSAGGSVLTEELALFLGRYGIRLPRDGG